MMKNHKIIAIGIIVLFVGLSISPVTAYEPPKSEIQDKNVNLEYTLVNLDGSVTTENVKLSEKEFKEIESLLSGIIEKIQSTGDSNDINDTIGILGLGGRHPILSALSVIFKPINTFKMFRNHVFIISQGWGYNLNPFKNSSVGVSKLFNFWHYSDQSKYGIPSKTFILRHGRLFNIKAKCLSGMQIGMMTGFKGIYIYAARPLPEESYTFFIGRAHHVLGFNSFLSGVVPLENLIGS